MQRSEALDRLTRARVGYFCTLTPEGRPHVVPVTFTVLGSALVHMIDHKPKTTTRLKRVVNIEQTPAASLLVDNYSDDWTELWWVRVDGSARIFELGPEWEIARAALAEKYHQYEDMVPMGPAVYLSIDNVIGWSGNE